MIISEVRIKLTEGRSSNGTLRAFASITLDGMFAVRDLKIINGASGLFVAMPSRKIADHCPECGSKASLDAAFCFRCGFGLDSQRIKQDRYRHARLHIDVAHPINDHCRQFIQDAVLDEYEAEVERSKQAGYVGRYNSTDMPDDDTPRAA